MTLILLSHSSDAFSFTKNPIALYFVMAILSLNYNRKSDRNYSHLSSHFPQFSHKTFTVDGSFIIT